MGIDTVAPSKPEAPKAAEDKNIPEVSSAPAESPKDSPKSVKPEALQGGVLKIMRGWNEIAESAGAGDGGLRAFLKMGRAFTDESGKVYIRFESDFARSMVDTEATKNKVRAAICMIRGTEISANDLVFGVLEGDEDTSDDLDGLEI